MLHTLGDIDHTEAHSCDLQTEFVIFPFSLPLFLAEAHQMWSYLQVQR